MYIYTYIAMNMYIDTHKYIYNTDLISTGLWIRGNDE